ncbi:hypothetical protein [Corynebacterium phocae]|uniref:hypothetical protein n=1 Tax=Corynebacterium phocae TaxID=161895 RepID=UPI000951E3DA|nr:hypothetical protein [Corynebacterium phocae]
MKITESLESASASLCTVERALKAALSDPQSVLNSGVSSISGFSEAGEIHGRFLQGDPGSAESVVKSLASEAEWFVEMYQLMAQAFTSQDMLLSYGLDLVSESVSPEGRDLPFSREPENSVREVFFHKPGVQLGDDFDSAVADIGAIDVGQIDASTQRWSELARSMTRAGERLESIASQIREENKGEAIDASVERVGQAVAVARVFAANAEAMAGRTAAFSGLTVTSMLGAAMDAAVIKKIEDPEERELAQKAALARAQSGLQDAVDASLPSGGTLASEFGLGAGGGSATVGLGGHDGYAEGLAVDEVVWPKALTDAAASGRVGPGSFEVVDGRVRPNADLGLPPEHQSMIDRAAGEALGRLGISPEGVGLQDVGTVAAGASVAASSPGGLAGPSGGGGAGGTSAIVSGIPGSVPGMGARNGGGGALAGSAGGGAGAGQPLNGLRTSRGIGGTAGGGRFGSGGAGQARAGGVAGNSGGLGAGSGNGPGRAGAAGRAGMAGGAGAGRAGAVGGSLGSGPGIRSSSGLSGGSGSGFGSGYGSGSGASGGFGSGVSGGSGSGLSGAGGQGSVAGSSAGSGAGSATGSGGQAAGGGMAGGGRGGQRQGKRGQIHAVTTKIEAEPNRRALLGKLPPAVPGVIGAWVRED